MMSSVRSILKYLVFSTLKLIYSNPNPKLNTTVMVLISIVILVTCAQLLLHLPYRHHIGRPRLNHRRLHLLLYRIHRLRQHLLLQVLPLLAIKDCVMPIYHAVLIIDVYMEKIVIRTRLRIQMNYLRRNLKVGTTQWFLQI